MSIAKFLKRSHEEKLKNLMILNGMGDITFKKKQAEILQKLNINVCSDLLYRSEKKREKDFGKIEPPVFKPPTSSPTIVELTIQDGRSRGASCFFSSKLSPNTISN